MTHEVVPGGPTREEVRELNRPKPKSPPAVRPGADSFGGRGKSKVNRAANVLAAGLTVAGGVGLAATVEGALKSTPPPRVEEVKPDPKRDNPPPGVVFPQSEQADAPVGEVQFKHRVFVPRMLKEVSQAVLDAAERPPLYLREFGAPERGVIMRNKVEQGGGNPAYVEMGDQELFNNMVDLKERYGTGLKLEITFYSSRSLMLRNPNLPRYDPNNPNTSRAMLWESWSGSQGIFEEYGLLRFGYREQDKTLEFHISLPEPKPGIFLAEDVVNKLHVDFLGYLLYSVFLAKEDGRSNLSMEQLNDRSIQQDFKNHPGYLLEIPVRGAKVTSSAVWIKMETVPTTGGK